MLLKVAVQPMKLMYPVKIGNAPVGKELYKNQVCSPLNLVQGLQKEGGEGRGRGDPLRKPQHVEEGKK